MSLNSPKATNVAGINRTRQNIPKRISNGDRELSGGACRLIFDCEAFNRSFEHVASFADSKNETYSGNQKKRRINGGWMIEL